MQGPPRIAREEHLDRQASLRELLAARGFGAALLWSRGGGTQDQYADVLWLTGLYTHQPFVPDRPGEWRATGHAAVVVPVEGPVAAVVDGSALQEPPVADRVVVSADPAATAAELLRDTGAARVALLGGAALAGRWERRVREPATELVEADELGFELRLRKSEAELELLRCAGRAGSRAMSAALEAARPGVTEAEVAAALAASLIADGGARTTS